jgi:creatinine amidohydrolase/Fe(II)-dependent formamide hydrolase-like protein
MEISMEGVLTDEIMKNWGPHPNRDKDVLVYSLGSLDEAHGPALSRQNDDMTAQKTSINVSMRTGFPYVRHLPYSSDRVGEIARDWCPAWMEPETVTQGIIEDIKRDISRRRRPVSHVVIISGHGGNNFLKEQEARLSESTGVPVMYVAPFENIVVSSQYGDIEVGHADSGEHSVAACLGLLDKEGLDELNEVASRDPEEALRRWKAICLGWYALFGGERYEPLRNPDYGIVERAKRFLKEKRIIADPEVGRQLYERNLENTMKQILDFTR